MSAPSTASGTCISRPPLTRAAIEGWLREDDPQALARLWARADRVRRERVGDAVHLRGLVEVSNHCVRQCHYCGIRAGNAALTRYRLDQGQVLQCAREAAGLGYGTVVLQAGEDPALTTQWVLDVVLRIKAETGLAVTLSLGERGLDELALWKRAGADRYLLRFETSNPALFARVHPARPGQACDRPALLRRLKAMGYEVGSGILVGLPGQAYQDLLNDLLLFRELGLDMVGVGPFIPHPQTPLWEQALDGGPDQVPNTELMTYKVVALTRLLRPSANIPSTTALATLNLAQGRELGLQRGANILMPNVTPPEYRALYEIYPAKACIRETAVQCHGCLQGRLAALGRGVGQGMGSAPSFMEKALAY
jgi:biotin synthase